MNLASLWLLDPSVTYLNHGSFGACPAAVLAVQSELRLEMEREPVDFLVARLPARLDAARDALAAFLDAAPEDLVFVPNATAGVNAVLRSLSFESGDELLVTSHTYAACRKTVDFVAQRSGARVVVATLPFPCRDEEQIVVAVLNCVSPRTRLALLDHVTSPTALVLPVARLIAELQARGVDTLVDGAHAPGMVPLALSTLGAAYYTGNAHKWLCAPKGAAFLHARRDRQAQLHPTVISHGYNSGFRAEFDWTGTFDPTPWLCIPEALRFIGGLLPGGWPQVMAVNRALALEARALLLQSCGIDTPCPQAMIGSIASIPLPAAAPGSPAHPFDRDSLHAWFRTRGVETWLYPDPVPLLRISAQLYNDLSQFEKLARLLEEALRGR
ncbi:MAG TPA: aminotransferase class V-fold PLP-dependent enzyme [Steroidobacteraceae bacterium]|nr:aminotransferase class V-fold PLP-dependent enzyme [Steroidobacteraceae bacterium]